MTSQTAPVQDYAIVLRALTADEGGGFLAEIPDLPGCTGDGETEQQANSRFAWLAKRRCSVFGTRCTHLPL